MKHLKAFFLKYQAYLQGALLPLGPWGVFIIAMIDAAAFGIPMDPIVAYFVHSDPRRSVIYAIMGAAGSALGSLVPYFIGYKGGEAIVAKKIGRAKFERVHGLSEKYGDLAIIVPAMLPPPTPFKLFVFSAGVTEMNWPHFLLAVFTGRILRFSILSALTIMFGPQIVEMTQEIVKQHSHIALGVLAVLIAVGVAVYVARKKRPNSQAAIV